MLVLILTESYLLLFIGQWEWFLMSCHKYYHTYILYMCIHWHIITYVANLIRHFLINFYGKILWQKRYSHEYIMLSVLVPRTIVWIFVALETWPETIWFSTSLNMSCFQQSCYIWSHWLNYFKNNSGLRNDLLDWEMSYSNEVHMNH